MSNLLPFNIEKAKAGEPVVTRDGRKARIIVYDRIPSHGQPGLLIALLETRPVGEQVMYYDTDGKCVLFNSAHLDLLHPEPEIWVNVYRWYGNTSHKTGVKTYHSKEEALKNAKHNNPNYVGAYKLVKE